MAVPETGVKQNDWQTEQPEPQVPAHQGLRAPKAIDGNSLSRAQQRRKNHECKSSAAERQPRRRPAHRSRGEWDAMEAVEQQRDAEDYECRDEPTRACD